MIDVVIPTIGRPSLARLLASLQSSHGPRPARILVVDDRVDRTQPLPLGSSDEETASVTVLGGKHAGPASARNVGWRASRARWIAFLDDDVLVGPTWLEDLQRDLRGLSLDVAASQGRVRVPMPEHRAPTDWERNVRGLETARWITADCAYRRSDLLAVGGFDERFRRAYREDADLALRIVATGKRIVQGTRQVTHPVRPAPWWISVRLQAGNADDVVMDAVHGPDWRERAAAHCGAYGAHAATVATAAVAALAFAARTPRLGMVAAAAWAARVTAYAWSRIEPGPRTPHEIGTMALTSIAIPFAAVAHRLRARAMLPALLASAHAPRHLPAAVFFDRDGTLIADAPPNDDPARVVPMPGAGEALRRLREAGVALAVVSNQPDVADGRLSPAALAAVNAHVETLLGPLGAFFVCTHATNEGCGCRKPQPGLIAAAAASLGVRPADCIVVGDIGADVDAAHAAGARSILVPTPCTLPDEIARAPHVARDLDQAADMVLRGIA